jgi:hypothetical protein
MLSVELPRVGGDALRHSIGTSWLGWTVIRENLAYAIGPMLFLFETVALGQDLLWFQQIGGPASESAGAVIADGAGGAYVAGATNGSLAAPNAGASDVWLARYDDAGDQLWLRQFGGPFGDVASALALDSSGGVFIAGYSAGNAYLARYSDLGDQLWFQEFGAPQGASANALCSDGAGGVFIAGTTYGDLAAPLSGMSDVFLARYDDAGNQQWIRQFGGTGGDSAFAVAADGAGGAYVAGNTLDLAGPSQGFSDAFVARFDATGESIWIRQFGSTSADVANAIALRESGGVFVAGDRLDPWPCSCKFGWLALYGADGVQRWYREELSPFAYTWASALASDGAGGVFVGGKGKDSQSQVVPHDAYIARFDEDGVRLWFDHFGTPADDHAAALSPDGVGGLFAAGFVAATYSGTYTIEDDAFLARYSPPPPPCYPNCDASTEPPILNVADFSCFLARFAAQEPYANCDHSTTPPILNVADFTCFLQKFAAGCP